MNKQRFRKLFLSSIFSIIFLMLTGCSGMHMNTHHLTPVLNNKNQIVEQKIQLINAAYIQQYKINKEQTLSIEKTQYHPPRGFFVGKYSNYRYRVALHDVIQIIIWNGKFGGGGGGGAMGGGSSSPGMSGGSNPMGGGFSLQSRGQGNSGSSNEFNVTGRGNIYFPYIGNIYVQGKTTGEIRRIVVKKLKHYFSRPQVTVTVSQFNSQKVAVMGAVKNPSMITITNVPLDVLTAVTQAGGPILPGPDAGFSADLHDVQIRRGKQIVTVDLNQLTAVNGSSSNWILKSDDMIYVPNNNASRIFALGSVNKPGPFNMIDGKMTLREALGDTTGVSTGSNPAYTYVIRDYHQDPKIFLLNLSSPDALNLAGEFDLKPGDVVFVSTSLFHNVNELLTDVTPIMLTAVSVQAIAR